MSEAKAVVLMWAGESQGLHREKFPVNFPTTGVDSLLPFGRRRNLSFGAWEQGSHAKEFDTTIKTSHVFAG